MTRKRCKNKKHHWKKYIFKANSIIFARECLTCGLMQINLYSTPFRENQYWADATFVEFNNALGEWKKAVQEFRNEQEKNRKHCEQVENDRGLHLQELLKPKGYDAKLAQEENK